MNSYNELFQTIEKLINNKNISGYHIKKDAGVSYGNIDEIRRGERAIENLTLETAEKLYNYQKQLESKEN
ncbi:MAG: hypothetical protein E7A66_09380 [Staphylococcus lugdunensis]|nr:hypothetical protein [Staphylococcus lugdunensis]